MLSKKSLSSRLNQYFASLLILFCPECVGNWEGHIKITITDYELVFLKV